jgi:hypothetical protein
MRALVSLLILVVFAPLAEAGPKEDALALLETWVKTQNTGNLAAYVALYDPSFVGVKRTSGGNEKTYKLDEWKADRAKMFKNKQRIAAEHAQAEVAGDKVTIRFVQRWQGISYADHGDKVLTVRGAKIVREELLSSAPGWKDNADAELDATALESPITIRVRLVAPGKNPGDCAHVDYVLELKDARGKPLSKEIGGGVIQFDENDTLYQPETSGAKLFEFGQWCAGGADHYEIVRSGQSLVARYWGEDEGARPDPSWITVLTVKLPAKATFR